MNIVLHNIDGFLRKHPRWYLGLLSYLSVIALGALDYLTGSELALGVFYIVPIMISAWYVGRYAGIILSLFGGMVFFYARMFAGEIFSHPLFALWNTVVVILFYVVITVILSTLNDNLAREHRLARKDPLTSVVNWRGFEERGGVLLENARANHNALSILYMDLDDFKEINDRFGHESGNRLLKLIARTLQAHVREKDLVARLGGDEFGVILPDTDMDRALEIGNRLRDKLMESINHSDWPVTISMGMATFLDPPEDLDALLRPADELLYRAKEEGKNAFKFKKLDSIKWSSGNPIQ